MNRDVRSELYLSLVLLGADPLLRASVDAWRDGEDRDILADLRNWNDAKALELKEWLATMPESERQAVQERLRLHERARAEASCTT